MSISRATLFNAGSQDHFWSTLLIIERTNQHGDLVGGQADLGQVEHLGEISSSSIRRGEAKAGSAFEFV